jgi:predicted GNAT superfamily acetyltransferase
LVEIPSDFQILKKTDVGLTQAWQKHTREIFEGAFAAGYAVTDFIYLKDERRPRSYYVLSQGNEELG